MGAFFSYYGWYKTIGIIKPLNEKANAINAFIDNGQTEFATPYLDKESYEVIFKSLMESDYKS